MRRGLLCVLVIVVVRSTSQSSAFAATESTANRLIMLGTKGGPSIRTPERVPTSHALIVNGTAYVIDTGLGVVERLVRVGVPVASIKRVFITHHHSDHNLDFGALVYTAWANGLKTPIDAYGPTGLDELVRGVWLANRFDIETRMADEGRPDLRKLVLTHEVKEGLVYQDQSIKVTSLRVKHPPITEAYAYRFDIPGKSIVFSGDTAYFPPLSEFAKGADVLVHEAMYGPGIEALAKRNPNADTLLKHLKDSHTLVEDVGRIAQAAGVKKLVLSHLVPGDDRAITDEVWQRAARTHYSGEIVVATDGMVIPLER